ncbi:aryl-alcohol dehydrogenase-like predicted oxidoreductase [Okibacterium sp. HSC-33S16]|uniref:aldo/keto reductase n=1 Tax=Okibacterium sp. HSC-33S16 TaxID=2910965 RepID=UPI00209E9329|nr:aldo/keto reductase [Okibacterium sp. HSC-33S16]MCP2032123.1 aryl-alcohol dehydrogenase-like predicted oxidoreductase [Okibacterium sp. HSC-33S16]
MNTSLPTATLGTTGFDVTRVGLGAFAIGGSKWSYGWGAQDDNDSVRTILAAVDRGINWVDTAAVYGRGHSEAVVGEALRQLPEAERPLVFSKGGLVWSDDDALETGERKVGAPSSLRAEVDASLRRLGVESIDLYQMHWPAEDGTPLEEYWATLVDLKAAGKLRAIGLSNHNVDELARAEQIGHVDSLQPPFSAIYRDAAADVIPWCAANGTGVIVYSPMQSGLLTGSFSPERAAALPSNDWRARHPDFQGEGLTRNLTVAAAMTTVAEARGISTAEVAIAWVLGFEGVTAAIVGARRPAQIDGWSGAGSVTLTTDEYEQITRAIDSTSAGSGPSAPLAYLG